LVAAGLTAVTIMDDKHCQLTRWLTFSLAFSNPAKICKLLRAATPAPEDLDHLLQRYFRDGHKELSQILSEHLKKTDIDKLQSAKIKRLVAQALQWQAISDNHHIITLSSPQYPALLKDTEDAPPVLYLRGAIEALDKPLLAVVGSRKASNSSIRFTHQICRQLGELGIGVVSGLARGIDGAAHTGTLDVSGTTIAVSATDARRVYPAAHKGLADKIANSGGLILTEYPLGSITRPWFFPQRNRIISGISLGVLVVEAAMPSGTLTTASHAMNQGREVMAIPGSVHNTQVRGCHALIKQGAALVENVEDIIDVLAQPLQRMLPIPNSIGFHKGQERPAALGSTTPLNTKDDDAELYGQKTLSEFENWLLDVLSSQSASADEIMTLAITEARQITISSLSSALGRLEINRLITSETGGRYARC